MTEMSEVSQTDSAQELAELKAVAVKVQASLDAKKMFDAASTVEEFLKQYPENSDAQKMLADVRKAHGNLNTSRQRLTKVDSARSAMHTAVSAPSGKSFVGTLLLCLFLGELGIHRFYVGKTGTGILMFLTLGGLGLWMLVDLIIIATGNFNDSDGTAIKP